MGATVDALRSGGKRIKTHDAQMVFKLPSSAKSLVNEIATKEQKTEGAIVRDALAEYFERRGYRA
jgi:predicted transcriptional regulator